jgi:hypothetical protein
LMSGFFEQHECLVAFWLDLAFPSGVFGPVARPARGFFEVASIGASDIGFLGPEYGPEPRGNAHQLHLSR